MRAVVEEGGDDKSPSIANRRLAIMAAAASFVFFVVGLRLYDVQIVDGDTFAAKSKNNFIQFKRLEHARGEIVDRQGRLLVSNRPSINVYVTPAFLPNAARSLRRLGRATGLSKDEISELGKALSRAVKDNGPPLLLARDLTARQVKRLRRVQRGLDIPLEALPVLEASKVSGSDEARWIAYLDPDHFPSIGLVLRRLGASMTLTPEQSEALQYRVRTRRGLERYLEISVRRDVPKLVEGRVALGVQLGELPGVSVGRANAREYGSGTLAAHLLGYVNELSPGELNERRAQGYRLGDALGRRGVERTFEDELRGTDGRATVVVDSKGREQFGHLADELQKSQGVHEPARPGNRVVLTIDRDLQEQAEAAFDQKAGTIVLMEAHSGRLLALTSTPTFNPQSLSGYFDPAEKARLDAMKALRPWRFRALQDHFAPGSTFKVVTALAGIVEGASHQHEHIFCPGVYKLGRARFRCWKDSGHGPIDLELSLARSCDVYYYTLGGRMGLDPIAMVGRKLGFGSRTGIEISGESSGIMPDQAWYKRRMREGYTLGAAVNVSIGRGAVSVTPLQLAVAYAAIANGGRVLQPQVALRIEANDGRGAREIEPKVLRQLEFPEGALAKVREGLRQVVQEPFGTAYSKRSKLLTIAGKTGTAQVVKLGADRRKSRTAEWKHLDHAWFAAVAPAEAPEVVVVVLVEHGGGSKNAVPIAVKVLESWWRQKQKIHAQVSP